MRRHPKAIIAGGILLGLIAVAVAFLLSFDLKGYTERRATAALRHPVTIAELHVHVFPFEVALDDINVADNAAGTAADPGRPSLMKAGHINAIVGFWRLLFGDLVVPQLSVENAVLRVRRRADRTFAWDVDAPADNDDAPQIPDIGDLQLRDVKVLYSDPHTKTKLTLTLATRDYTDGRPPSLIMKGEGIYADQPSTLNVTAGSILTVDNAKQPYPVDGTLVSGPTSITIKGSIIDLAKIAGLDVMLTVKGNDAEDLYRVAGVALPPTPAYVLESHLDRDGPRWSFKNMKWTFGKSDIAGELLWDVSPKVPMLTGQLHGKVVSMDDLAGFIGAAPGEATTPVEERRQAADLERGKRGGAPKVEQTVATELIIPDKTIDPEKFNSMNAKVHFDAAKVIDSHFPLDSMKVDVVLQDGVLTLKPLEFGADQGKILVNLVLNSRAKPITTKVEATVQAFPLERLLGKAGRNTSWGAIGGHAEFDGTGDSMHRILATSDGNVGLAVGGGQVSLFLVELMGIDIAESLGIMVTKDKPTAIRCIVGDFALEKGKMTARAMVADTADTNFSGSGSIDLGREVFDMRVHAHPKDMSPATLRSPLVLTGTFSHPHFGPDIKALALRSGIAVALGVVLTPLASLLVLVDPGGGKDADCATLFEKAAK